MGATISSEQTAAAEGTVGKLRRDPFAMLPFCGYNMADYFAHWLSFETRTEAAKLPKIFQVNWFRKDENGKFLWPGFAENARVIEWITDRLSETSTGETTPIGRVPAKGELNLSGLNISDAEVSKLFELSSAAWSSELDSVSDFFNSFGSRLPESLKDELATTRELFAAKV